MERRRRSVSSSLGSVDLGESKEYGELIVEDERELYETSANPHAKKEYANQGGQSQIPDHLRNNPNIRVNHAEDEQDDLAELERRIQQAKMLKRQERARPEAVGRLEVLVGIGRLTDSVTIQNVTFSLRSLKSKELKSVMEKASVEKTNVGEALSIRNCTLAYSIYEIEGQPLSSFLSGDSFEKRLALMDELDNNTVDALWAKYQKMHDDYKKSLISDLGSNAKEVIDSLKK